MMLLWIPFVILLCVALWRPRADGVTPGCCGGHAAHAPVPDPMGADAIEIARLRLARGEIDAAQFEEIRRVLGS